VGYVVNKFRGDSGLFAGAHPLIEARTGLRSLGVVTWLDQARDLPKEDIAGLAELARNGRVQDGRPIVVTVPHLPRLANFDDLDPLAAEPEVDLRVLEQGAPVPADTDLVLLPGSKATLTDLAALRAEGWDVDILAHVRRGGWVLGLCAGYQMLGRGLADPAGLEGPPGATEGLGLLEVDTVLEPAKVLALREGLDLATGEAVRGYEIHMGRTEGLGRQRPMVCLNGSMDGARSADGRVMGCYLHGLLAADGFRAAFLGRIRGRAGHAVAYEARVEAALDALAEHLERCLDLDCLLALAR
jgi:adenosylcobyric acid synthase